MHQSPGPIRWMLPVPRFVRKREVYDPRAGGSFAEVQYPPWPGACCPDLGCSRCTGDVRHQCDAGRPEPRFQRFRLPQLNRGHLSRYQQPHVISENWSSDRIPATTWFRIVTRSPDHPRSEPLTRAETFPREPEAVSASTCLPVMFMFHLATFPALICLPRMSWMARRSRRSASAREPTRGHCRTTRSSSTSVSRSLARSPCSPCRPWCRFISPAGGGPVARRPPHRSEQRAPLWTNGTCSSGWISSQRPIPAQFFNAA